MKKLLIASLLLFIRSVSAQNPNMEYNYSIKLYNFTGHSFKDKTLRIPGSAQYFYHQRSGWEVLHPTVAFQFKSRTGNFHEIEMSDLKLRKNTIIEQEINDSANTNFVIGGGQVTESAVVFRYENILIFNSDREKKLVPALGVGISPYFQGLGVILNVSNRFKTRETYLGANFFVAPRINYFINEKFFLDLNIPVTLFDLHLQSVVEDNPAIPVSQRKTSSLNFSMLPKIFSARVGVGMKL